MKIKYSKNIMVIVRNRLGLEDDDTSMDDMIINVMTPNEVFESVLEYQGFHNYAERIKGWVKDIYGVELNNESKVIK